MSGAASGDPYSTYSRPPIPNLTNAPMDSQGQSSGRGEPRQEAILAPRSVPNSQNQNRSPRMPLPHAAESAPRSARNPFRFLREMATASSGETAMPAGLPSSVSSGSQTVGNQHRPTNLLRLPRYSTLSPAVHGVHPVENLGPATGVNLTSPLPQYTARDYVDHLAEKQGMPPSSMAPVNALDEKSELRSSPVQEQHPPLPFSGDVDANVAELRSARPYDNLNMSEEIPHLVAIDTKEYERYKRAYCYPEKFFESGRPTIDPLTTSFEAPPPPSGWKAFIHPEGARYFYYDDPNYPVPVLTEAWLYDKEQCAHIHRYMTWIFEYMEDRNISFCRPTPSQYVSPTPRKKRRTRNGSAHFQLTPSSDPFDDSYPQHLAPTVLVLDIRLTGNTGYYFVDHPTQTIFWLEPYDYSLAVGEVHTDYSTTLIGLEMKSHYWTHNDLFPHLHELEEKDLQEVDDMVGFAIGDALTSLTGSATIFNPEQLKQLQKIIHRYDMKRWERRRKSVGERRMICRVLADIYHERFLNLHGERGARLNNTQSIHYSPYRRKKYVSAPSFTSQTQTWFKRLFQSPFKSKPQCNYDDEVEGERAIDADPPVDGATKEMYHNSMLMNLLSLVMFGGPGVHMRRLRDMTVDRVVSKTVLSKYMERMMEEWRDVTLYGTVLLGANVSFLTIQSVDEAGVAGPQRTPSQRASYFSILASMGTIVSSFMLLGRHREVADYTFIAHRSNSRWGLESLALMYGMPFSLAIWSIISFFMSFAILWFDNTDYVVMGLVGSFSLLFAFFLFWAILAPYEKQPYEFFVSRAADRVRRAGKKSMKAVRRMTKRLSTAGAIAQKEPTSPSVGRVSSPELPPNEGDMPDMRPSMSSSVTRRISGTYKQHRRTWSETPSTTIEGDGDPPDTKKTSLDTGQRQEGVQMDAEEAPSAGKGARFYSPV